MVNYQKQYLKYKRKYIELKNKKLNTTTEDDNNMIFKKIIYSFFI
jgi:phosphate-selective porin